MLAAGMRWRRALTQVQSFDIFRGIPIPAASSRMPWIQLRYSSEIRGTDWGCGFGVRSAALRSWATRVPIRGPHRDGWRKHRAGSLKGAAHAGGLACLRKKWPQRRCLLPETDTRRFRVKKSVFLVLVASCPLVSIRTPPTSARQTVILSSLRTPRSCQKAWLRCWILASRAYSVLSLAEEVPHLELKVAGLSAPFSRKFWLMMRRSFIFVVKVGFGGPCLLISKQQPGAMAFPGRSQTL